MPRLVQWETSEFSIEPEIVTLGAGWSVPRPGMLAGLNSGTEKVLELSRLSRPAYTLSWSCPRLPAESESLALRS